MIPRESFVPRPDDPHQFTFDEIEEAFRMMASKEGGIIKPLIHFEAEGE
ncbi:hypothetical protein OG229_08670 [Streptomyces platensis]|nr:hypothetical protein OG229_08670 [Streptomyces platensis]